MDDNKNQKPTRKRRRSSVLKFFQNLSPRSRRSSAASISSSSTVSNSGSFSSALSTPSTKPRASVVVPAYPASKKPTSVYTFQEADLSSGKKIKSKKIPQGAVALPGMSGK